MPAPEEIEAMLGRLMPVPLSQGAQDALDAVFDEALPHRRSFSWKIPASIAATMALICGGLLAFHGETHTSPAISNAAVASPELVLVGESERIEEMTDEGWLDEPDGRAIHSVRFRVVEEDSLRDEATGIVVQVSQPREEVFLTPVTAF